MRSALFSIWFLMSIQVASGQLLASAFAYADRYPYGIDSLRRFIAKNARFPAEAVTGGTTGLSVSSVTITPWGDIDRVSIYNSLGSQIDGAVVRMLYKTEGQWIPATQETKNLTIYCQIYFGYREFSDDGHLTFPGDSILEEFQVYLFGYIPFNYKSQSQLTNSVKRAMTWKNHHKALVSLEELIRRDPFNRSFYKQKLECFEKLDWEDSIREIDALLQASYNGSTFSLLGKPDHYGEISIIKPLKDGTFSVRRLNRDSSIIYSGKLISRNPDVRHGMYYFFDKKGRISATGRYQNNYPVGIWNYINPEGEIDYSLDYSSVVKYLVNDEAYTMVDSAILSQDDFSIRKDGTFSVPGGTFPSFNGGSPVATFSEYISKELKYPVFTRIKGIKGRVEVEFIVDKTGSIRRPVILKGGHLDLNMEALRVIIKSPRWTPGFIDGEPVNTKFMIPVLFPPGKEATPQEWLIRSME